MTSKICKICIKEKPVTDFYFYPSRYKKDGYSPRCKECSNVILRKSYPKRRTKQIEYVKKHRQTQNGKEMQREYSRRWYSKHKEYYYEYVKKQREDKQFSSAYITFQNAIRSGTIVRPNSCQSCRGSEHIQAHHSDYSKPLDVQWLCVNCHNSVHHV